MRWTVRIIVIVAVLWVAYAASPFVAAYNLIHAVESGDAAGLARRVNFPAVRRSLTEQIVATYLQLTGKDARLGQFSRGMAVAAIASIADPIVAQLASAQALVELLQKGQPSLVLTDGTPALPGLKAGSLGNVWQLILHAEPGIRSFEFAVPTTAPAPLRFKLQFRLTAWTWKLTAVELPERLRVRLAQELIKRIDNK